MDDREFLDALEGCTLPGAAFDHRAHVRAAYLYSLDADFVTSLGRIERAIRAFAASLGAADKYHETITIAFLSLVRRRMFESGPEESWEAFADAHPDLLDPQAVARYYPAGELKTRVARHTFVLPELSLPARDD